MLSLICFRNNSLTKIVLNSLNSCRTFSQKHIAYKLRFSSRTLFQKSRINKVETLWKSNLIKRQVHSKCWEQNTNVLNNVILYKYDGGKYFKIAHIFGICNIVLWITGFWYAYIDMFKELWIKPFKQFIQDNLLSLSLFIFSTTLGPLFYMLYFFLSMRSIKYIILNKGGKYASFVTFHPIKSKQIITAPIEEVYCIHPRTYKIGMYTSLKINNYKFNFLIDKRGTYVNGILFDNTIAWRK